MLCPICNGFEQLTATCPSCLKRMDDYGQLVDFTAPYAPYQPNADASLSMETMISNSNICKHVIYCPNCENIYEAAVKKWE